VDGTSADEAEALVPGQRVTAYVPPEYPEGAVLDRGLPFLPLFLRGVGGLIFLVASVVYAITAVTDALGLDWPLTLDRSRRSRNA
jgi:hypothetical protein